MIMKFAVELMLLLTRSSPWLRQFQVLAPNARPRAAAMTIPKFLSLFLNLPAAPSLPSVQILSAPPSCSEIATHFASVNPLNRIASLARQSDQASFREPRFTAQPRTKTLLAQNGPTFVTPLRTLDLYMTME